MADRPYTQRSDAELAALADVSASDLDDAARTWRADAPAPLRALLDATAPPSTTPNPEPTP